MTYVLLWEFEVRPTAAVEFERRYGPDGAWAALFREAPDYIGTALLRDDGQPARYLTIDRWRSRQAYDAFRSANAGRYGALDEECEHLTTSERILGAFTDIDGPPA